MWISEFQTKAASGDWLYRRHYPSSRFWISSGAGQWSLIIFVLRFGVVLWDRKCLLWFFLAIWILIVITLTIVSNWHLYIFLFLKYKCTLWIAAECASEGSRRGGWIATDGHWRGFGENSGKYLYHGNCILLSCATMLKY